MKQNLTFYPRKGFLFETILFFLEAIYLILILFNKTYSFNPKEK